ncbi:MAG: mevalonate kinase [Bacteroidota bacterium]
MIKDALYYSKILLFGEYGIIQDSMGLSVPFDDFKGNFLFETKGDAQFEAYSNGELKKFLHYLKDISSQGELSCSLDLVEFERDLKEGMFFDSSIPSGFGVGSSGAIVAAIYGKYAIDKIEMSKQISNDDILSLKKTFGEMESYFHGKSSGLDPLICYLNIPILIKSKNEVGAVGLPEYTTGNGAIFLLDTGMTGKTAPLVQHFLERCKEVGFRTIMKKKFKKYNDAAIEAFLNNDISPLMDNVKRLSQVLLDNFKPMIPKVFHKLWKEGIESNAYYLKLCGSGGGGFILGFTEDFEKAQAKLGDYELKRIYSF